MDFPLEKSLNEFKEYCSQCTFDGNGEIYNRDSKMLWIFKTQHRNGRPMFPFGLLGPLPDFSFYDTEKRELLVIKCERRYPLTQFAMVANGLPIGTIKQGNILLKNTYTFEFNGGLR